MSKRSNQDSQRLLDIFNIESEDIFEICEVGGIDPSYSLFRSNLSHVDLTNRSLDGFDFSRANLEGALLKNSSIFLTDLEFAKLSLADLAGNALFVDSAILPVEFIAQLSGDKRFAVNQKTSRNIRNAYNLSNESQDDYEGYVDSDEYIYNLAVLLDTVAEDMDPSLYLLAEYVLNKPVKWDETPDKEFLDRIKKSDHLPSNIKEGMIWVLENKLSVAQVYTKEEIDDRHLYLPPFFWREKLHIERFAIDSLIVSGRHEEANERIDANLTSCAGRNLEWRWAQFRMLGAAVNAFADPSIDVLSIVKSVISALPQYKKRNAGGDAVWVFYLASIHADLPAFRNLFRDIASKLMAEFWNGRSINKVAEEALSDLTYFWKP
ncbi:pentapeptide repeat-containing protein [Flavisphingomonas formosensis]|uniref:pentapeptide repeat-containing protein n=1 Tax=Flavisphingomonas formosensis TaxID=861534 RepID=UPI0012FB9384|nr:pentapeptide repeat-containing protein [Sphingomonas formosensis]